jgi:predicted ATPase/predicted negative regulator of RcsB-dependent stress response
MTALSPGIRTPDQRLRIFVSSTLGELAPERKAARGAIERLRLAPVMFEIAARPHPPRDLYRAYLRQSDVFLGIYWQSYGWIAPSESISGLEDEYRLAPPTMPKLIYIKRPAESRDAKLTALLDRVRSDDTASYTSFTTDEELAEFVVADLATLLADRFDQSRSDEPSETATPDADARTTLPSPLTELIGREADIERVSALLHRDKVRLVTLTGPGGIGKSRLALAVGRAFADELTDGAVFVELSALRSAARVPSAIAEVLGVRDTGDAPLDRKLALALRRKKMLLILDNVEQIPDLGPTLLGLLSDAPDVRLLLTSRSILKVSPEHRYEVNPLAVPSASAGSIDEAAKFAAVALFVERARAVKPDFELTAENLAAVVGVCLALEGVPLALELAAARVRILTPDTILSRLGDRLNSLGRGPRDLPDRQQTLDDTIAWSTGLLSADENRLLNALGVFNGEFSLEAATAVSEGLVEGDPLDMLERLVDSSLIRQRDHHGRSMFRMLATLREFAVARLEAEGLIDTVRSAHARFYSDLGSRIEGKLEGEEQRALIAALVAERGNLRAAMRYLLEHDGGAAAAEFAWTLYVYWWVGGLLGEIRDRMREVLDSVDPADPLPAHARAVALYFTSAITFWRDPADEIIAGLTESAELFHVSGDASGEALALISLALAELSAEKPDPEKADNELELSLKLFRSVDDEWGEGMALVTLGRVSLAQGKVPAALGRFDESLAIADRRQDALGASIARHHVGRARLLLADIHGARDAFAESLKTSVALSHQEGIAYGLEGFVALAALDADVRLAGRLLGALESLRDETGLSNAAAFAFHDPLVEPLRSGSQAAEFAAAVEEGRGLSANEAVVLALGRRPERDAEESG